MIKLELELEMKSHYVMKDLYLTEITKADAGLSSISLRSGSFFYSKYDRDESSIKDIKDLLEIKQMSASEVKRGEQNDYSDDFFIRLSPCWIRKSFLEKCQRGYGYTSSHQKEEFKKLVDKGYTHQNALYKNFVSNYVIKINPDNLLRIQNDEDEYIACYRKDNMLFDENFKCILYLSELKFSEKVKEHPDYYLLLDKIVAIEEERQTDTLCEEEKIVSKKKIEELLSLKFDKSDKEADDDIKLWSFPVKTEKYDEVMEIFKQLGINFKIYLDEDRYYDGKETISLPAKIAFTLQEPKLFDIVFSDAFVIEEKFLEDYEKVKKYLSYFVLNNKLTNNLERKQTKNKI